MMAPPVGKRIDQHARHAGRLAALRALLSNGACHGVEDLARYFDVNRRTIHRDLLELREMGARIDSSIGRGGGVRLRR